MEELKDETEKNIELLEAQVVLHKNGLFQKIFFLSLDVSLNACAIACPDGHVGHRLMQNPHHRPNCLLTSVADWL